MTLDGPGGTVLAAIGEQQDHGIASNVISQSIASGHPPSSPATLVKGLANQWLGAQNVRRPALTPAHDPNQAFAYAAVRAQPSSNDDLDTEMMLADPARETSFGAVYEYTSALDGRPLYVGGTDMTPELAFQNDHNSHNGVRSLARGGGTAKVVWAAVGSGSVGYEQMRAAREAVAANRSTRQRVQELSSAKPYSYHSHRMVR